MLYKRCLTKVAERLVNYLSKQSDHNFPIYADMVSDGISAL